MPQLNYRSSRGDTLIEVLFAVAVFSAVAVGAIVIMNRGITTAQTSLEINLVRNQIDTQAELLRQLNDAKLTSIGRHTTTDADGVSPAAQWDKIVEKAEGVSAAADYDEISSVADCDPDEKLPAGAFFIDPRTTKLSQNFETPGTFAQIRQDGPASTSEMIWMQAVASPADALNNTKSYDFHIRACWESPGTQDVMKLGTIVRLYAPATN